MTGIGWFHNHLRLGRISRAATRGLRGLARSAESFRGSARELPASGLRAVVPPAGPGADEWRIARLAGLVEVLHALGVSGMLVLVDRVDEPVAVSGSTTRTIARLALVQKQGTADARGGMKFLLPLELRDEVRESSDFFQEARLDSRTS